MHRRHAVGDHARDSGTIGRHDVVHDAAGAANEILGRVTDLVPPATKEAMRFHVDLILRILNRNQIVDDRDDKDAGVPRQPELRPMESRFSRKCQEATGRHRPSRKRFDGQHLSSPHRQSLPDLQQHVRQTGQASFDVIQPAGDGCRNRPDLFQRVQSQLQVLTSTMLQCSLYVMKSSKTLAGTASLGMRSQVLSDRT